MLILTGRAIHEAEEIPSILTYNHHCVEFGSEFCQLVDLDTARQFSPTLIRMKRKAFLTQIPNLSVAWLFPARAEQDGVASQERRRNVEVCRSSIG